MLPSQQMPISGGHRATKAQIKKVKKGGRKAQQIAAMAEDYHQNHEISAADAQLEEDLKNWS